MMLCSLEVSDTEEAILLRTWLRFGCKFFFPLSLWMVWCAREVNKASSKQNITHTRSCRFVASSLCQGWTSWPVPTKNTGTVGLVVKLVLDMPLGLRKLCSWLFGLCFNLKSFQPHPPILSIALFVSYFCIMC